MTPDELFLQATELLIQCMAAIESCGSEAGNQEEKDLHLVRTVTPWLAPVYGSVGYADMQLIDQLQQVKYQAPTVHAGSFEELRNFCVCVQTFREFLQTNYGTRMEETFDYSLRRSA